MKVLYPIAEECKDALNREIINASHIMLDNLGYV